jgi:hypothetical protein
MDYKDKAQEFAVIIDLGSDAMRTPQDVAVALRALAAQLTICNGWGGRRWMVRDGNGNVTGEARVS